MQTLKDLYRWFQGRDGTLFMAGFAASGAITALFRGNIAWAIVHALLTAMFLFSADEQVGE